MLTIHKLQVANYQCYQHTLLFNLVCQKSFSILVKSFRQAYGVTQTYVLVSVPTAQKPSMHTNSIIRGHRRLNHHQNEDLILLLLLCHGGKHLLPFVFHCAFASGTLCAPKNPTAFQRVQKTKQNCNHLTTHIITDRFQKPCLRYVWNGWDR